MIAAAIRGKKRFLLIIGLVDIKQEIDKIEETTEFKINFAQFAMHFKFENA